MLSAEGWCRCSADTGAGVLFVSSFSLKYRHSIRAVCGGDGALKETNPSLLYNLERLVFCRSNNHSRWSWLCRCSALKKAVSKGGKEGRERRADDGGRKRRK